VVQYLQYIKTYEIIKLQHLLDVIYFNNTKTKMLAYENIEAPVVNEDTFTALIKKET
jgi:hypothetical protein